MLIHTQFHILLCSTLLINVCAAGQGNGANAVNNIGKYIYRFPSFEEGTIVFRNGIISSAKLNYNIASDEMHFISQSGDTLSLSEPATISFISLQGSRFYFQNGFLQAIDSFAAITLAFKQELIVSSKTKGAFGIPTEKPGVNSYNLFFVGGKKYDLDNETSVESKESYLLGDVHGHFSKADKDYILVHFKGHDGDINAFIKAHHTNFKKKQDLVELLSYCSKLTS